MRYSSLIFSPKGGTAKFGPKLLSGGEYRTVLIPAMLTAVSSMLQRSCSDRKSCESYL